MNSGEDDLNVGLINGLWEGRACPGAQEWKICSGNVTLVSSTWTDAA